MFLGAWWCFLRLGVCFRLIGGERTCVLSIHLNELDPWRPYYNQDRHIFRCMRKCVWKGERDRASTALLFPFFIKSWRVWKIKTKLSSKPAHVFLTLRTEDMWKTQLRALNVMSTASWENVKSSTKEQIKRSKQTTNLLNRCNKPSVCTCRNLLHIKNIINISNTGKHWNRFIRLKLSRKTVFFWDKTAMACNLLPAHLKVLLRQMTLFWIKSASQTCIKIYKSISERN